MIISSKNIRNVAVIGHSGEGKTTLCEAMLFNGGAIDRMGSVAAGTTVMDFDEQEKAKQLSINASRGGFGYRRKRRAANRLGDGCGPLP